MGNIIPTSNNMKKYSVRVYLHTFCDYEVEAENEKEAKEIAEDMEYDMDDMLGNICRCDDTDVEEIPTV